MYAEQLKTPHQFRERGVEAESLLSAVAPEAIAESLASLPADTEPNFVDQLNLSATDYVTEQVREALWFPLNHADLQRAGVDRPLSWENLTEKQIADCYGYAVVLSECLQRSSIDHWIGYVNGHSTVLVPLESGKIRLQDPLARSLRVDLQTPILNTSIGAIKEDVAEYGRSAAFLDTYRLALRAERPTDYVMAKYPWLTFRRNNNQVGHQQLFSNGWDGEETPQRYRLLMSIFEPQVGRNMLHQHREFYIALTQERYLAAAQHMIEMSGSWPEIDARKPHRDLKRLITGLYREQQGTLAHEVLDHYFSSFRISDDSRITVAYADMLRCMARQERDSALSGLAASIYQRVLDIRPSSSLNSVSGKLDAARRLSGALAVEA